MDPIYLDYAATTPVREEVRAAMDPYLCERFGNPSSIHRWGREAQAALETARSRIAECLGAKRREIVFVRGGTESDNLAVLGRAESAAAAGNVPAHVVTARTEHKAVLDTALAVARLGGRATILEVDREGRPDPLELDAALTDAACLASFMWVNNEIGVVHPIADFVERAHAHGVAFHTDAVQALGTLEVRVDRVPVDYLSFSGHKIYGPKSAGALFVREGSALQARVHGGGQEMGIRPGTQDVAGAVGLAEALALAVAERDELAARLQTLGAQLERSLAARIPGLRIHGQGTERAPHIVNVGLPGVPADLLLASLDMAGLAVSGGSACSSGSPGTSHVLAALYRDEIAPAAIRYSLGRGTTADDIDRAVAITLDVVGRLAPAALSSGVATA